MEKRINKRIEEYMTKFKDNIRIKAQEQNYCSSDKNNINNLLEYIYEYNRLVITSEDVSKRNRVKNEINEECRCIARRSNNEQCTRKQKEGSKYCGTHNKQVNSINDYENNEQKKRIDVVARSISGVIYYIDKYENVYNTADILECKENPSIIAKAKVINGVFTIPSFTV